MTRLEMLLDDLSESIPAATGSEETGLVVSVTEVSLDLPVESRIDARGLALSAPRGRYATGFASAHGRLRVRFVAAERGS